MKRLAVATFALLGAMSATPAFAVPPPPPTPVPTPAPVRVVGPVTVSGITGAIIVTSGEIAITNFPTIQVVSGTVAVSNFPATQPVSGTVAVSSAPTTAVTGTFFQATQPVSAAALPLPAGASTEATVALVKAKTDNLDVALSTRTKPADQQHAILDSGTTTVTQATGTNLHAVVDSAPTTAVTNAGLTNLDVALSTRLKPADTLTGVTTVGTVTTVTNPVAATESGTWTVQPGNTANTTAWKVDGSAVTQPVSAAGLTNLDVALSTRLKPADTLTGVTTVGAVTSITNPVAVTNANLDATISSRLKPADTLTGVTTVGAVTSITNPVAVTNANLDATISSRLKPADTLAGVTTVGAVTSITNSVAVTAASLPLPSNAAQETGGNLSTLAASQTAVGSSTQATQMQQIGGWDGANMRPQKMDPYGTQIVFSQSVGPNNLVARCNNVRRTACR